MIHAAITGRGRWACRPNRPSFEVLEGRVPLTAAPHDVSAVAGAAGVVVSWLDDGGGPGPAAYVVEARRLRDTVWSTVGTAAGATNLVAMPLDAGAHYAFRVIRDDAGDDIPPSAPSAPSAPVTTPSLPTFQASARDDGTALLSWEAGTAGSVQYTVEHRRLDAGAWTVGRTFAAADGAAVVDGLEGGSNTTFRVVASSGVRSPRTVAVTIDARPDAGLQAVPGAERADLAWNDPHAAARATTTIEYRPLSGTTWVAAGAIAAAAGAGPVEQLQANRNYVFRLRQDNLDGTVTYCRPSRAITVLPRQHDAPYDVVAEVSATGVRVTWKDDWGTGWDYSVVGFRMSGQGATVSVGAQNTDSVVLGGLQAAAHYQFKVIRSTFHGLVQFPSEPSRPLTTPPALPFTATAGADGTALITWDAQVAGAGAVHVEFMDVANLQYPHSHFASWNTTSAGPYPAVDGTAIIDARSWPVPGDAAVQPRPGVEGGTTYTFRLLSPTGFYTPRSAGVTIGTRPDLGLAAVPGVGSATVTWNDPFAPARPETVVEYRRVRDSVWSAIGAVATTSGSAAVTGLDAATHYVFRLRQRDGTVLETLSKPSAPVTTLASAPPA